jgi:hypothetical protein
VLDSVEACDKLRLLSHQKNITEDAHIQDVIACRPLLVAIVINSLLYERDNDRIKATIMTQKMQDTVV